MGACMSWRRSVAEPSRRGAPHVPVSTEVFVLMLCLRLALAYWGSWYVRAFRLAPLARTRWQRLPLGLTPPACLALLVFALRRWAAGEVRDNPVYVILF